jgi:hypothetical protein
MKREENEGRDDIKNWLWDKEENAKLNEMMQTKLRVKGESWKELSVKLLTI